MTSAPPHDVCVVGGGFTGAAAAIACLNRLERPFRLSIIEPNAVLGRGVAYGGHQPLHLLNVRARDLSIHADRPGDFLNWAFRHLDQGENDEGLLEGLGHAFLPRQLFGEYVRQRLVETVDRRPDVTFNAVTARATACCRIGPRFLVRTDGAQSITADVVILATAYGLVNSSPAGALAPFGFVPPAQYASARSMLLIGSGLTMVDVLLAARREGFAGKATIISRRGQLPREHAAKGVTSKEMALPRTKHLSRLTASVRIACEAAEAHSTPWQAVVNGLRPSLQSIWQELGVKEQARFLRHVRPFWDAHRHRLPSEVHEQVHSEFDAGRAVQVRARVVDVTRGPDGFTVTLKGRGPNSAQSMQADLVFDCTGHRPDLSSPLISSLIGEGLAHPDAHHLGLAVTASGQVSGRQGNLTPGLFALGPLGQGSLWEITAVPEIVRQADLTATCIADSQHCSSVKSA